MLVVVWVLSFGIWSLTFAREYVSLGVLGFAFLPAFLVGPVLAQVILSRIRVALVGDCLVVSSGFGTRRVRAQEIDEFRAAKVTGGLPVTSVYAFLRDGSVIQLPGVGPNLFSRRVGAFENRLTILREWLAANH